MARKWGNARVIAHTNPVVSGPCPLNVISASQPEMRSRKLMIGTLAQPLTSSFVTHCLSRNFAASLWRALRGAPVLPEITTSTSLPADAGEAQVK